MLLRLGARSLFDPLRKVAGLAEHEVVVVQSKRLKGCGCVEPFGSEVGRIRTVQGGHKPIGGRADNEAVNTSPPKVGTVRRDVIILRCIGFLVGKVLESGPTSLIIEFSTNQQNGIANGFRIHSSRVLPPEQTVGSVLANAWVLTGENGLLAVGFA